MKTQFLILLIFSFSLLTSCHKDIDDTIDKGNEEVTINGTWHLKNVSGGFAGIDVNYNQGDVLWTFNQDDNTLIVENNIMTTDPESTYARLESGTYTYEVEQNEGSQILLIDGNDTGEINLSADTLTIDDESGADGFIMTFVR